MTHSSTARARQLADWLSATDIDRLELRGPGESVCLQRVGGRVEVAQGEPAPEPVAVPSVAATASSVGVFLHRHPLHHAALAAVGAAVRCGQVVGLLQVGALLLPVMSPSDGVVAGLLVEHGATVGYGSRLVELQ